MENLTTYDSFINEKFDLKKFLIGAGIFANFMLLPMTTNCENEPKKPINKSSANISATIVEPVTSDTSTKTKDLRHRSITRDGRNFKINYE